MRLRSISGVPLLAAAVAIVLAAAGPARADCAADITALKQQVAALTDTAKAQRVRERIAAAVRELAEGDQQECREAVEDARKELAR